MAYKVGVLCHSPMSVDPAAVLDDLAAHGSLVRTGHRSQADGWCECEVQFGESQYSTLLTVSQDVERLRRLADSAFALDASPGEYFVLELTLSGDVDWPPILAFLKHVIGQHHGLLYDEVAGFEATLT